jgi:hypothetical protein
MMTWKNACTRLGKLLTQWGEYLIQFDSGTELVVCQNVCVQLETGEVADFGRKIKLTESKSGLWSKTLLPERRSEENEH